MGQKRVSMGQAGQTDDRMDFIEWASFCQMADTNNQLIRRWDNTPHFPNLPNFPHHIHDGQTGQVIAGKATNIIDVLDEIAQRLGQSSSP